MSDPQNEEPPPDNSVLEIEPWRFAVEEFEDRILHDLDFMAEDAYVDLPPEVAEAKRAMFGVDDEYYVACPPEPTKAELAIARKTLAKMLEVPGSPAK